MSMVSARYSWWRMVTVCSLLSNNSNRTAIHRTNRHGRHFWLLLRQQAALHNHGTTSQLTSHKCPNRDGPLTKDHLDEVVILGVGARGVWRPHAGAALLPLRDSGRPRDVAQLAEDISHVHDAQLSQRLRRATPVVQLGSFVDALSIPASQDCPHSGASVDGSKHYLYCIPAGESRRCPCVAAQKHLLCCIALLRLRLR